MPFATAAVVSAKFPRYFQVAETSAGNSLQSSANPVITIATGRSQGNIMKGVFIANVSGVYERATTGDAISYYCIEVRDALGRPSKTNYLGNDDAGQAVVLDLTSGAKPYFIGIDNSYTAK